MATTVKIGWLQDKNGDKFAPKTLTSQVQTLDGVLLEDKLQAEFDLMKEEILENIGNVTEVPAHSHTISEVTNLQSSLDAKVPTSRTINGKALTSNITLSASDVNAYTKSEIDDYVFITIDDIDEICGTTILNAEEVAF